MQIHDSHPHLSPAQCRRARLARDVRFDGLFFIAVKTTGIFCRPICPVVPPLEANVEYFDHAAKAFQAGYRPCLRCRPDSAPGSCAWRGTDTTFTRAIHLIDAGSLQSTDLPTLAARLGVGDRYLRRLFQERLGLSPKAYALFGQVMFAKKLLHESTLSVSDIAAAAGFNSLRRFNDAFVKQLQLPPSAIRRDRATSPLVSLTLAYRPPLNWTLMLDFWRKRCVSGVEWVDGDTYGRSFRLSGSLAAGEAKGYFSVTPILGTHSLQLQIDIDRSAQLKSLVTRIRQILDLDADVNLIEQQLGETTEFKPVITPGLRIPGIWEKFESGVRAIMGQQVSVAAARTHLERLTQALGEPLLQDTLRQDRKVWLFPTPQAIAGSDLAMLKMPASRRDTLRRFAAWYLDQGDGKPVDDWLALKGIGPWTVGYVKMRALGNTDIWLAGDLGIKKALAGLAAGEVFNSESLKPWRSYATFHLWHYLSQTNE